MKLDVVHSTRYHYALPVKDSFNELRMHPVSNEHQECERFLLRVMPPVRLRHYLDLHSNHVSFFELHEPHTSLELECRSRVITRSVPLPEDDSFPMARVAECARMERCHEYLQPSPRVDPSPEAWRLAVDASHGETDLWRDRGGGDEARLQGVPLRAGGHHRRRHWSERSFAIAEASARTSPT